MYTEQYSCPYDHFDDSSRRNRRNVVSLDLLMQILQKSLLQHPHMWSSSQNSRVFFPPLWITAVQLLNENQIGAWEIYAFQMTFNMEGVTKYLLQ